MVGDTTPVEACAQCGDTRDSMLHPADPAQYGIELAPDAVTHAFVADATSLPAVVEVLA